MSRLLPLLAGGIGLVVVVFVGIAALGGGGMGVVASPEASAAPSAPGAEGSASAGTGVLIRDDSPTLGPADAPVTLVEFMDPECEACRAYFPVVKQILAEYPTDLRLVVRYVAGHGNSALAVIALEAARAQDEAKYWAMLELMFERQPQWGEQETPQPQAFIDAAAAVGLDVAPIQAALQKGDTTMVERDLADAVAFGLRGTPTFYVNGVKVTENSPEALRAAIEAAR